MDGSGCACHRRVQPKPAQLLQNCPGRANGYRVEGMHLSVQVIENRADMSVKLRGGIVVISEGGNRLIDERGGLGVGGICCNQLRSRTPNSF